MNSHNKRKSNSPGRAGGLLDTQVPGLHWWMLRLGRWGMLLGLAALLVGLWQARLVPAVGTDSLIYHLTMPARWLQQGYLSPQDLPFHDGIAQYSPALSESLCYLLMRLTGDEHLCWLVQPAFLLVMACFFYRSARLLGSRRPLAMLLTGMLLIFEPFDTSAVVVNNDIVLTTGAAIFLYGLLATRLDRHWPLVAAAAGLGLMLATKYIGVIYSAIGIVLLLPFAVEYLRRRLRRNDPRRAAVEVALAVALLLAGSFFLLRNWVLYGNPLYPSIVKIGGVVLFQGLYDTSVFARYGLTADSLYKMLIDDKAQFGMRLPFSALLWLVFLATPALWIVAKVQRRVLRPRRLSVDMSVGGSMHGQPGQRSGHGTQPPEPGCEHRGSGSRSRRPDPRVLAACLAFPVISIVLYFFFTPFWREHRLLYPVYYALWLSGAYVCSAPLRPRGHSSPGPAQSFWKPRNLRPVLTAALLVGLLLFLYVFWFSKDWFFLIVIAVGAFVAFLPWRRRLFARRVSYVLIGAFVVAALTGPWWYPIYRVERLQARRPVYLQAYDDRGLAWSAVDAFSAERPLHVAYTGTPIIFPLFGYFLQNQVVYVPISPDDHPQAQRMDPGVLSPRLLEPSPGLQLARDRRRHMDADYWLRGLADSAIDLLLVVDDPDTGGAEQELGVIQSNPQTFQLILQREEKQPKVYLFRVLKGPVVSDPSVVTAGVDQ